MLRHAFLLLLLATLAGCTHIDLEQANATAKPGTGFMVKTVQFDGETRRFGCFIPHEYVSTRRWPVMVFLHGSEQCGDDGIQCMDEGAGPLIWRRPKGFPFITVFPQSRGKWKTDAEIRLAIACLDQIQREYATDPDRVILTGLSDGGLGTWLIGARYKERFAALVPLCAYAAFEVAPQLTGIPIWAFHNSGDFMVSPANAREMARRIQAAGGNIKFTEFGGIGHNCWSEAYDKSGILDWMQAQRRPRSSPTGN